MLRITVKNAQQSEQFTLPHGKRAELGRHVMQADGVLDIWLKDSSCSRNQLRVTEQPDGRVLIENLSSKVPVQRSAGPDIAPNKGVSLVCPFSVSAGSTKVDVTKIGKSARDFPAENDSITQTLRAVEGEINPSLFWSRESSKPDVALTQENLMDWFSALIAVQRSAAGSADFYREIADATVDLIGLDYGLVLLMAEDGWSCVAANGIDRIGATWSETVVQKTIRECRTFYAPLSDLGPVLSLAAMDAVVAAPILRIDESVVGVIYGARRVQPMRPGRDRGSENEAGVSELQAQLVQLLAASAATGLARAEKEAEAAKLRGQFEDFCSPEVVRELHSNPRLLEPSERSVTVMFCDVRGFTRLCERLNPAESNVITTNILDQMAECILQADGLIIDFYGDGIAAMWNAPCDQPNHARLAVDCAVRIQQAVAQPNAATDHANRQALRVGIGIHTGRALVGNVGGSRRLKYGPRGNTVNLTSRIESFTKQVGVNMLISAEAARQANVERPEARRIGQYQLAGTENAVELFEYLGFEAPKYSEDRVCSFETAVKGFASGDLENARKMLKSYQASGNSDSVDSVAEFLIREIEKRSRHPDDNHPSYIQIDAK